ncbi:hypothetical protein Rpal_1943 [Rhodopseudomonas palustris TIE-1]|uniref:hypothetical protein n=1 Tax=Rhodopseudomonas palustris TaxID=1076 RepID=UPI000164A65D|nr:hypothetical protein [Rhodopseudomonas palustris]ACF00466.1 hypothetical protein Rpal_1943 [Rhodopseudomonas palustris TIE-1]
MKDWYAVFALALVIIIGSAAGLVGTLAFLLAFFVTWYLLSARELGFAQARAAFGVRFDPPIWTRSNWLWLERLFDDSDKLLKAAAVAMIVMASTLMVGAPITLLVAVLIAAYLAFSIHRDGPTPPRRVVRIHDAGADISAHANRNTPIPPPTNTTQGSAVQAPTVTPAQQVAEPAPLLLGPFTRIVAPRPRQVTKPRPSQNRRPVSRGARKAASKRQQRKAARNPARPLPPLPSRKPGYAIALKPRRPLRQPPQLRQRRRLRRPMTLMRASAAGSSPTR